MGLLDNKSVPQYYQGNDHGNYQFTSLEAIIAQFEIAYVGEGKIIPKIKRADISFHAMRALQELSFDTFKSIKSQQIDLPPSLTMILPQDYVNYTKISTVDSAGIKHPLYPTSHTSNPFQILQNTDGTYTFGETTDVVLDGGFEADIEDNWLHSLDSSSGAWDGIQTTSPAKISKTKQFFEYIQDTVRVVSGELEFKHLWKIKQGIGSRSMAAWQQVDLSTLDIVNLTATARSGAQITSGATVLCGNGVVRVGLTTTDPSVGWVQSNGVLTNALQHTNADSVTFPGPNQNTSNYDLGYLEWSDGTVEEKELTGIDVTSVSTAWIYIQSFSPWTTDAVTAVTQGTNGVVVYDTSTDSNPNGPPFNDDGVLDIPNLGIQPLTSVNNTPQVNMVDNISLGTTQSSTLSHANADKNSSTWNNYKAHIPSENNVNDYQDYQNDIYWPNQGKRYGLDPQHAQVNGSFYIDNRM